MEERLRAGDPLRRKFLERAKAFSDKYPKEGKTLLGDLMLYGSFAPGMGGDATLWDIIKSQINHRVSISQQRGNIKTAEDFIDQLFEPNNSGEITADIIMGRLQIG